MPQLSASLCPEGGNARNQRLVTAIKKEGEKQILKFNGSLLFRFIKAPRRVP